MRTLALQEILSRHYKKRISMKEIMKTITEVMAAGPAKNGKARGRDDNFINSYFDTLSATILLFLSYRLPLTTQRAIMNKIAPPAILNVSAHIYGRREYKNRRDLRILERKRRQMIPGALSIFLFMVEIFSY